jgi:tetratricopeptide (TPR) repeat protein
MPDPSTIEILAMFRAGLSFEVDGALERAEQNYGYALELLKPGDKENFIALHYRLGRVAEALGRNEEADEHYIQVAAT